MGLMLALVVNIAIVALAPVIAKKMPEGVNIVYYSGAEIDVTLPATFPIPAPQMKIHAFDIETSSFGSGDEIILLVGNGIIWWPLAHFTTNDDSNYLAFLQALWGPTPAGTNTIPVSDDELKVDRHGNEITVSLTAQDIMKFVGGVPVPAVLPAITIELNKVGGSIHTEDEVSPPGWTAYLDIMGFNGNGVCTLGTYTATINFCEIVMHGILIYEPSSQP